ncbi:MAG: hypothetical protein O4860_15780 [Trichodesmium sp. St2_bin2_1]|nr:hypothetical protein [Trichodesmium sp. St2_bin2_1]
MQSGQILRNHYKIIKSLGHGGFGDTYLAQDLDLPGNPKCYELEFIRDDLFVVAIATGKLEQ